MGKFTVTHDIHCNVERFWKVFFDKEFNTQLYTGTLGFPDFKVVEQTDDETTVTRKVAAQPKMEVPGALQKLIGPASATRRRAHEEGRGHLAVEDDPQHPGRQALHLGTRASAEAPSGTTGARRQRNVRRIAEITIEAKIFGLGGLIEGTTEKQMRDGWDKSAVFMNKYLEPTASSRDRPGGQSWARATARRHPGRRLRRPLRRASASPTRPFASPSSTARTTTPSSRSSTRSRRPG